MNFYLCNISATILETLHVTGEDIFLTCIIAKFVKSDIQTFTDCI